MWCNNNKVREIYSQFTQMCYLLCTIFPCFSLRSTDTFTYLTLSYQLLVQYKMTIEVHCLKVLRLLHWQDHTNRFPLQCQHLHPVWYSNGKNVYLQGDQYVLFIIKLCFDVFFGWVPNQKKKVHIENKSQNNCL